MLLIRCHALEITIMLLSTPASVVVTAPRENLPPSRLKILIYPYLQFHVDIEVVLRASFQFQSLFRLWFLVLTVMISPSNLALINNSRKSSFSLFWLEMSSLGRKAFYCLWMFTPFICDVKFQISVYRIKCMRRRAMELLLTPLG